MSSYVGHLDKKKWIYQKIYQKIDALKATIYSLCSEYVWTFCHPRKKIIFETILYPIHLLCKQSCSHRSYKYNGQDSFIQALRRFIARRGTVRYIRSDNGTKFIGASNELKKALDDMNQEQIRQHLMKIGTD